jgi:hypothetical protein
VKEANFLVIVVVVEIFTFIVQLYINGSLSTRDVVLTGKLVLKFEPEQLPQFSNFSLSSVI